MNAPTSSGVLRRAFLPALAGLLFLAASSILQASASEPALKQTPPFNAVYVIGDSLSDTGRTSAVLTQAIGSAFPPPPYAPGRMSNGPLWIEYFTPMLGRSYQPLDNFSWAGANTGRLNVFSGLPGMLDELEELRTPVTRHLNKNALYVVFGGANDFFRITGPGDAMPIISAAITNIVTIVANLRSAGAENIVVVGVPNIGLTPRGAAARELLSYLSFVFNTYLNAALDGLEFPVVRVNLFSLIGDFVNHPANHGFTNVTDEGRYASNADTYLFWDDVHPTTRGHRLVAEEVYRAVHTAGLIKHPLK